MTFCWEHTYPYVCEELICVRLRSIERQELMVRLELYPRWVCFRSDGWLDDLVLIGR